jgi:hypothetical protein
MFRFTIRDVLWLTVVAAFAVGWWIDRGRLAREVKMLEHHRDWTPIVSPPFSGFGAWPATGPNEVAPAEMTKVTPVATTAQADDQPLVVEWSDLAFTVKDRATFDLTELPEGVRRLEGKRVRLRGYFHGAGTEKDPREFLLIGEIDTRPTTAKWGTRLEELPIHQLAAIEMVAGRRARFTREPVAVTGRLALEIVRWEGQAFLVFRILADRVDPVSRRSGYHPALSNGC